ncbi:MAG: hypothetical protein ABH983_01160 [Candidatus Micrarchaeota archaeon]|nr:hypothetical protein [Candidatus Micrarchaeota archaeon]MBU1681201.1 hypothetical protein [Candidatus Micrarchaeota archaeon]
MVKKKTRKKKTVMKKEPKKAPESTTVKKEVVIAKEPVLQEPQETVVTKDVSEKGSGLKTFALAILFVAVVTLAVYVLFIQPTEGFVPGSEVDSATFLQIFDSTENIYIVMDVRGVTDPQVKHNVLQCGVDFAASSGMGPKNATYFSIGEEGCITPKGSSEDAYCFNELRRGVAIYIHEGSTTSYHSNGILVGVGSNYSLGTCGIHRS